MNVFVLCTGRCGSTGFAAAAAHIRNYTVGHETRVHLLGPARLAYPPFHIEADNRLSWMLGRLERAFGDKAKYVHLVRDPAEVAESFVQRWGHGIIRAYEDGILMGTGAERAAVCADYIETVNTNIEVFLADKEAMRFELENATEHWPAFWRWIEADGDLSASAAEWSVRHNPSHNKKPAWTKLFR